MPDSRKKKRELPEPVTSKVVLNRHPDLNRQERYNTTITRMRQRIEGKRKTNYTKSM